MARLLVAQKRDGEAMKYLEKRLILLDDKVEEAKSRLVLAKMYYQRNEPENARFQARAAMVIAESQKDSKLVAKASI